MVFLLLRRQMKCSDRNKQCNSNCKLFIHVGTRSTPEIEIAGISRLYSTQTENDFKNQFKQFGSNTHSMPLTPCHISKFVQPLSPVWNWLIQDYKFFGCWKVHRSNLLEFKSQDLPVLSGEDLGAPYTGIKYNSNLKEDN